MTNQTNEAAERSAHVTRGEKPAPAEWPVVRMPDGTWKLKSVVALEARIAELETALRDLIKHTLDCELEIDELLSRMEHTRRAERREVMTRQTTPFQLTAEENHANHSLNVIVLQKRIKELEAAVYQYVNHVVSCEGISFIDADQPWAKLINEAWGKQAALEGEWDGPT